MLKITGMQENINPIFMGVDPGYDRLGWAFINEQNGKPKIINSGIITTNKEHTTSKRLFEIYKDLEELISKYNPKVLMAEHIFFSKNQKTAFKVAEVRGVLQLVAEKNHVEYKEINPMTLKKYIAGTGNATKRQVAYMVEKLVVDVTTFKTDDVADAVALAYCAFIANKRKV